MRPVPTSPAPSVGPVAMQAVVKQKTQQDAPSNVFIATGNWAPGEEDG